ncbi:MAG: hypothetical protein J5671_07445 [Bacteroidaceae bacterium]|nr:hypothetical protein [Bacteroidaceae bacterium]
MRDALKFVACLIGAGVIIGAFLLFGRPGLSDKELALDIVVSLIVYGLFVVDIFVPWLDLGDKAQRKVGSLGLRWTINWLYAILAIVVMFLSAKLDWALSTQLLIHAALLGLLALGYSGVFGMNDKVASVYAREEAMRSSLEELKSSVNSLLLEHEIADINLRQRIEALKEDLRYTSSSDNGETRSLEERILKLVGSLNAALNAENTDEASALLNKLEKLVKERKQSY